MKKSVTVDWILRESARAFLGAVGGDQWWEEKIWGFTGATAIF